MEIEYHGGNCFSLSTKKATVLVDDVNANVFLMNDNGQTIERLW